MRRPTAKQRSRRSRPRQTNVVVVGDPQSSNANRLVEVALDAGCPKAVLANDEGDLDWQAIDAATTIDLSAAASTPASCVDEICRALSDRGFSIVELDGLRESVLFKPVVIDVPSQSPRSGCR